MRPLRYRHRPPAAGLQSKVDKSHWEDCITLRAFHYGGARLPSYGWQPQIRRSPFQLDAQRVGRQRRRRQQQQHWVADETTTGCTGSSQLTVACAEGHRRGGGVHWPWAAQKEREERRKARRAAGVEAEQAQCEAEQAVHREAVCFRWDMLQQQRTKKTSEQPNPTGSFNRSNHPVDSFVSACTTPREVALGRPGGWPVDQHRHARGRASGRAPSSWILRPTVLEADSHPPLRCWRAEGTR